MKRMLIIMLLITIAALGSVSAQAQPKQKNEHKKGSKQQVARKIYINFARLDELQSLPGISKETAQAIIDARPYESVNDLLKIDGIDEELLKSLEKFIQVRMNVNGTPPEELEKLPWLTSEIAHAIVDEAPYPIVDGSPYTGLGALMLIDGMNESILAEIQDFLEIRMDINAASLEDLQTLPGMTPEIAGAILEKRPFDRIEELLSVDGVDESLLAGIERLIYAEKRRGRKMPGQGR